ncbi:MAG TPA: tRNA-uridine aminocarboxypropyltransferase [Planctomycetota bacterium]|nr:tRNA-uridine aminocarboxypropyltransferase [Planctomycetota bacterium]
MGRPRVRLNRRCLVCGLWRERCVCAELPRAAFRTRILVVQHAAERFKPTNSGRLLAHMVEGAQVLLFGAKNVTFDARPLADPEVDWRVLFPRPQAEVLGPGVQGRKGRRLGLVLLDGTWHQATRMARRVPGVADLPFVTLPEGPPPVWTVRTQHLAHGRSTFEAGLDALEALEGASTTALLRDAFVRHADRLLRLKGKSSRTVTH